MVNLGQEITVNILEEIEKTIPYLELEVKTQLLIFASNLKLKVKIKCQEILAFF